jgi:hypothetical protein
MKASLRISIKDYRRNKNLKILLVRATFPHRQFHMRMNGAPWPKDSKYGEGNIHNQLRWEQ